MGSKSTQWLIALLLLVPVSALAQHGGTGGGAGMGGGTMGGSSMGSSTSTPMSGQMASGSRMNGATSARAERRMHAEAMIRAYPDRLALDPHGNLMARDEIVGLGVSEGALATALSEGYAVRRRVGLEGAEGEIVVMSAPAGTSIRKALDKLRSLDSAAVFDFNHIYGRSGEERGAAGVASSTATSTQDRPAARKDPLIGLVDGGLDASHAAFRSVALHVRGCDGHVVPSSHGTAVASRIVAGFGMGRSAVPPIELFAADVYCDKPTGGSADEVASALSWLMAQRVPVINVSLVGPRNALLEKVVASAVQRGFIIVAAVGNDGPSAPALFPAAYPGVIAVTGVDRSDRVLLEAGRGRFLSFSAPGADIEAASLPDGFVSVRGTSFAAPIVASQLALRLGLPDKGAADNAIRDLATTALDLGTPGPDPVYGIGCIGCAPPSGMH